MAVSNLNTIIPINETYNYNMFIKWNSVINDLLENNVANVSTITGVFAEKYRYDMAGLLEYLGVDPKFHYPTMLANGYLSSREYKGDTLDIKILDSKALYYYYTMFTT